MLSKEVFPKTGEKTKPQAHFVPAGRNDLLFGSIS